MHAEYYRNLTDQQLRSIDFLVARLSPNWNINSSPGRWTDLCDEIRRWVYWSRKSEEAA